MRPKSQIPLLRVCSKSQSTLHGVLRFFPSWTRCCVRKSRVPEPSSRTSSRRDCTRPFWSALWHAAKSPERNTTNATMPKVRLAMGSVELDPRTRRADVACPAASTIRPTTGTTPFSHQRFKARALTADGPVPLRPSLRSSPSMSSVARWTRSTTSATCP